MSSVCACCDTFDVCRPTACGDVVVLADFTDDFFIRGISAGTLGWLCGANSSAAEVESGVLAHSGTFMHKH
jgi:hypothetical protein